MVRCFSPIIRFGSVVVVVLSDAVLSRGYEKKSFVLNVLFVSSPAVDLVELHDAAGPVGAGAAPPAAETEAAARSRRHEPASLNGRPRRSFVSGNQQNHHQENREEKKQKFDEDELQLKWKIKPVRNGGGWGGDATPRRG